jgi:lipopolysaccharide assembly outer membrane protein LptD (OstA)
LKYGFLAFLVYFPFSLCFGQTGNINLSDKDSTTQQLSESKINADTLIVNPEALLIEGDSLGSGKLILPNTPLTFTSFKDSLFNKTKERPDSILYNQPIGDISTTINYSARDSIFFDLKKQKVTLYGNGLIDYGDIQLEADKIDIDWTESKIKADYSSDTTGRKIGKPIFTEKGQSYETDQMVYNFQTRKAIISGIITQQGEAFVQGEKVFKNEHDELFIQNAKYTTCNLANPHFHIASRKLKAIPGSKVISGPFNLAFREITTPIGFFFGMFPQPNKKSSGVVVPSYGEERRRGFFLRDGGYYFAISDYTDVRLTGDIYSKGGYALNLNNNYKKRYSYNGNMRLSYNRFLSDEPDNKLDTKDFSIAWTHSPESKGTSRFSSSVNIRTNSFNQNNNLVDQDFNQSISAQISSNVSYSKTFKGTPFNISASARHNQNIQTKALTITAPEFTYNMNRIYPFKNVQSLKDGILGKLNFSHTFTAKNDISNNAVPNGSGFTVTNRNPQDDSLLIFNSQNLKSILARSQIGGRHSIPVSTSFTLFKFLTVSPNVNYNELWYTKELDFTYDADAGGVRVDTLNKFSRAYDYNMGASFNTRLYGMLYFKKGRVQAIRHVLTPQIGFSYTPDFTSDKFGYYKDVQINERGDTQRLSKYQNFAYGSPAGGESANISLTLNNNIEMKVKEKADSTGEVKTKKVKIFDNLSIGSGYNMLADSFNLQNIQFNTRTSFFDNLISVNFTGTFDPYTYILDSIVETGATSRVYQRKINEYAWNSGNGLGTLSNFNVALSFRLTPDTFKKEKSENGPKESEFGTEEELEFINRNPEEYIDFSIPWSISTNYSVARRRNGFDNAQVTQSLNFNGDLSLTEKTKINFRSGYDFESKEFTQTSIDVVRDLHCWTMRFNWVPFGRFQSFNITIAAKSSLLQDLKLEKRRRFFDNL